MIRFYLLLAIVLLSCGGREVSTCPAGEVQVEWLPSPEHKDGLYCACRGNEDCAEGTCHPASYGQQPQVAICR